MLLSLLLGNVYDDDDDDDDDDHDNVMVWVGFTVSVQKQCWKYTVPNELPLRVCTDTSSLHSVITP